MKRITENQFYDLLCLKLSSDATHEQLILLQEQLLLNPEWQFLYDQILQHPFSIDEENKFSRLAYAVHTTKMRINGHFSENNITGQTEHFVENKSSKIIRKLKYFSAIAACLLSFFLFKAVFLSKKNNPTVSNEVTTKKGSKSNLKLPDGTQVWLNSDSKLIYSADFSNNREVVLIGEAFFDVTHDEAHPFVIHSGNANIKVLGTAFNVRNYPSEKTLQTSLMRGKIEVSFTDRVGDKIILKPLEKLIMQKNDSNDNSTTLSKNTVELTKVSYATSDSTIAEASWVNDKMVFINEPLENIAAELERHFGVKVIFKNEEVKKYRYTGVFGNITLENVLVIIQLSKKINYKTNGNVITIY
jgi:ferric-dicitrate binding protein FerR (iron transport regulator)